MFVAVYCLWLFCASLYPLTLGHTQCPHHTPYDLNCDREAEGKQLKCYGDGPVTSDFSWCEYEMSQNFSAPAIPSSSWDFPAAAVDFRAEIVYYFYYGHCLPVLNISWKMSTDASFKYLKGYHLKVVDSFGQKRTEDRVFVLKISPEYLIPNQLKYITMHYPCIGADSEHGHDYKITLQSLPASSLNVVEERVMVETPNRTKESDPAKSYFWSPSRSSVRVRGTSVNFAFQPAPVEFNLTSYEVDLSVPYSEVPAYISVVNVTDAGWARVSFFSVSPGTYFIQVRPVALHECTCRIGPNIPEDCRERCQLTIMTRVVIEPEDARPVTKTFSTSSLIVIGLLVAVVAVFGAISIFVIVVIKLRLDQRKGICFILYEPSSLCHHEAIVTKLSCFLERHCSSEVHLVNAVDTAEAELPSVVETLKTGKSVVAIHSERPNPLSSDQSMVNMFDRVLSLFQEKIQRSETKLFHVSFNYTSPEFVRGVKIGRRFRLMQDVLGLIAELNTCMGSTGLRSTCADCPESFELFKAFAEAEGPRWFEFDTRLVPPDVDMRSMCTVELEENLYNRAESYCEDHDAVNQRLFEMDEDMVRQTGCACVSRFLSNHLRQVSTS